MKKLPVRKCLTALILIFTVTFAYSQNFNTLFWLNAIPQSSYNNPALIPQPRLYISMPAMSSIYVGAGHSGFALGDFLRKNPQGNFYWDTDRMLNRLGEKNSIDVVGQFDLIGFGFRAGKNYLGFNISENFNSLATYPKDLMTLLFKGNDSFLTQNRPADLDGLNLQMLHYREFAIKFAREFGERITAGIRLKALQGLAGMSFERSNMSLTTEPDNFHLMLHTDILIHASDPGLFTSDNHAEFDMGKYLSNTQNLGGAVDLGLTIKPIDRLTLAFSVRDLGFINWKSNTHNLAILGEYEFKGIDLTNQNSDSQTFDNVLDSLEAAIVVTESTQQFRTPLPAKISIAAGYDLGPTQKIALIGLAEVFNGQLYPSYTISYSMKPAPFFSFALSYSIINRNFQNFGAGFHFILKPLQFYFATNNLVGALSPHSSQAANIHLGLNWVFGTRPKSD